MRVADPKYVFEIEKPFFSLLICVYFKWFSREKIPGEYGEFSKKLVNQFIDNWMNSEWKFTYMDFVEIVFNNKMFTGTNKL